MGRQMKIVSLTDELQELIERMLDDTDLASFADVVSRAKVKIETLQSALEETSDLAITLCAECRKNIHDKEFTVWAHDKIGVGIIDIRNKAIPDE
jgi:predicted transcriptional regulator